MSGVRVVEVAQFTYVPVAGAVLADWGAEVIKIEHAVSGDAQRGLQNVGGVEVAGGFFPLMEHPNRGKRGIGLALENPDALEVLYDIVRNSDVFVTNFLPEARRRLKIDVEDIRAVNPDIIYVRGSALGSRGPEANNGGYDAPSFWFRGGSSAGVTWAGLDGMVAQPGPAWGDTIGGMNIAGGIAAALFSRSQTGEPSIVDVSLLASGAWANALSIDIALAGGTIIAGQDPTNPPGAPGNPLVGTYSTQDGRYLNFCMLQPGRYWADLCRHLDRPDLISDQRFDTTEKLMTNWQDAVKEVAAEIGSRPYAEWIERFKDLEGQWAPVQNALEVGHDVQLRANGHIATVLDDAGNEHELVTSPVQFDESPATPRRAPHFAEHTDEILRELGADDDRIIALKIAGAVT
ncbi:L-carnitine dehydratase/bile acid-inducible protein F [Rhodococcus ruber BKS 20-38]|uniref:L-carnitine dehydratase/bile acid-inducible protein F n=1 Tax=Rhodococcus ruber BKS 20-38 TaxID=1278076 RepID=M2Y2K7_9NOCA|nr:CoA transferase [Rhodococcus ruber]EME67316.1 L-carnitine dehydratase/bile acid-inducible protein F [Rhodococcus ruber BKS 20-38]